MLSRDNRQKMDGWKFKWIYSRSHNNCCFSLCQKASVAVVFRQFHRESNKSLCPSYSAEIYLYSSKLQQQTSSDVDLALINLAPQARLKLVSPVPPEAKGTLDTAFLAAFTETGLKTVSEERRV